MVTLKKEQEIYEEHRLYEFAERDYWNIMGSVLQRDRHAQTRAFEEKTSANKRQIRSKRLSMIGEPQIKKLGILDSQLLSQRLPGFFVVSISRRGWSCIPKLRSQIKLSNATRICDNLPPIESWFVECSKTFDNLGIAKGKIDEYRYFIRQYGHLAGAICNNQIKLHASPTLYQSDTVKESDNPRTITKKEGSVSSRDRAFLFTLSSSDIHLFQNCRQRQGNGDSDRVLDEVTGNRSERGDGIAVQDPFAQIITDQHDGNRKQRG